MPSTMSLIELTEAKKRINELTTNSLQTSASEILKVAEKEWDEL